MKKVFIIFVFWVITINLFGLLVQNRLNLGIDTAYRWIDSARFHQNQSWSLVGLHTNWDAEWYLDIAKHGYSFKGPWQLSNIDFPPVYPFAVRAAGILFLGNYELGGLIVSLVSLFVALVYLYKLIKEFHPKIDPELAIALLLIYPTAFFLTSIYAESIFLALIIPGFYYLRKKNFWLAGTLGYCAALTKIPGVFLALAGVWEYIHTYGWKRVLHPKILSLALPPLGVFSFALFHYFAFGDLLLYLKQAEWWGRSFKINKEHLEFFSHPATTNIALDFFFVALAIVAIYFVWRRLRPSYGIFMLAALILPLSTGTITSINRYIMVFFPAYIWLASIKNKYVVWGWSLVSILLLGLYTTLYVNNYWAG